MNRQIYVQSIRLIGKLVRDYGIDPGNYSGSDRELLEQAIRDNAFYLANEEPVLIRTGSIGKPGRKAQGV